MSKSTSSFRIDSRTIRVAEINGDLAKIDYEMRSIKDQIAIQKENYLAKEKAFEALKIEKESLEFAIKISSSK